MPRAFDGASSQSLEASSAPATAAPLTISCRFRPGSSLIAQALVTLKNSASGSGFDAFRIGLSSGDFFFAACADGSAVSLALAGMASSGTWYHGAGVFASSTSRFAYLNGTPGAESTSSRVPSGINRLRVGVLESSTYLTGDVCDVAIWDTALTDAQIAMLAAGAHPTQVQPGNLVYYDPLGGNNDPEVDWVGGLSLVNSGSTKTADPPGLRRPRRRFIQAFAATPLVPVASFTGTPLTGSAPLSSTFTDASANTPTSWLWEKNDGSGWVNFSGTPTAQNPTESFAAGTWSVRMTATNAAGSDTQTRTNYLVSTAAPVASFTGTPLTGLTPQNVVFTDASTNAPTSWLWEKNSGSGWVNFTTTPTAQNPTEAFTTGVWSVRLTATNAGGSNTLTRTDYVTVTAPASGPRAAVRRLTLGV